MLARLAAGSARQSGQWRLSVSVVRRIPYGRGDRFFFTRKDGVDEAVSNDTMLEFQEKYFDRIIIKVP